jgi:DNA-binding winged helix-turn-helix (wHTH) protein
MHWDRIQITPVARSADAQKAKVLWLSPNDPSSTCVKACDLAALDLLYCRDLADGLKVIAKDRPDIVIFERDISTAYPDAIDRMRAQSVTENLAFLPYDGALTTDAQTIGLLGNRSSTSNFFITIRSALRRERPVAIKDVRQTGAFILDCQQYRFSDGDRCATISKMDQCLIGPFFDLPEIVLDRQTLLRLVFGNNHNSAQSLDVYVYRMRRHLKKQIAVDPLRTVRGVGFKLAWGEVR